MSSTSNVQSYLPYVFRPVYTWTGSNFSTTFNVSNVDTVSAGTAAFGRLTIGDSNQNVYVGNNVGNAPSNATAFVTYYNTAVGTSAAAGISNASNSEFFGYLAGNSGKAVYNTIIVGMNAGGLSGTNSISNITNSILIGTSNSTGLSNVSNTISIGGNAGGGGSSNIFIGTSNGIGAAGSSNIVIGSSSGSNMSGTGNVIVGNGVYPAIIPTYYASPTACNVSTPTNMSNKFFLGAGSNILAAGDFSNKVFVVGSTNTNAYKIGTLSSFNISNATASYPISLDAYNYARFERGIGIAIDPGTYTLDVNGQFNVSDGFGKLAFSNVNNGTIGQSNSFVELRPVDISNITQMTLRVSGNMILTPSNGLLGSITAAGTITGSNVVATNEVVATGYSSIQNAGLSVATLSNFTGKTLSNVTGNGTLATYTTTVNHTLATGNWVTIGSNGTSIDGQGFTNITAQITSNGPATFTIPNSNVLITTLTAVSVTPIAHPLLSFPITKSGLLVGTVYDTAISSNYQTANWIIRSPLVTANTVSAAATLGSSSLLQVNFTIISNQTVSNQMIIGLSNTAATALTVAYNFTYYPTS